MNISAALVIETLVVLLFSGFFSGLEIAFVSSSKLRFEMERANMPLTGRLLGVFYNHPNNFISTLLVGNNIALVIYGILMAQFVEALIVTPLHIADNELLTLVIQTIVSTLIVLVTGEFLPKTIFKINPNRMLQLFALPAFLFYIILWPISRFTSLLSKVLLRLMGLKVSNTTSEQAFTKVDLDYLIQSNIDHVENEEEIEDEVKIFQNALDLKNVKVRDCMVPRTEIHAVENTVDLATIMARFIETGISKLIVYEEDIDNIKGFIHSSEMFRLQDGDTWTDCIREVPIVPETMNAQKMLSILMQQKKSLAVVVDEFGGTNGIVTLEDLVEEIFGDIEDEHDNVNYIAKDLGNGEYVLSARLEIEKANEILGLDLPESDEYVTVGGLILNEYQSFPKLNEVVKFGHWEFKIIKNTTTKIELVRLKVTE